ncbi:MAG: DMT family transporter [Deltaproteobacteria bacterium]|nr:DMT family transporter [Deltaproteobacteria bacterium]
MTRKTALILGFTVLAWASAFPAIRLALAAYTPAQLALFRFALASAVLLSYGALMRLEVPPWRDVLRMGLLGVLGISVYAVLLGYGQRQVPAGSASLLISSAPVWMVLIAAFIGRERPTARALVGIAVSFSGVVLIASGRGVGLTSGPHALAVLGAAFAGAAYNIAQKPLASRYGAVRFTIVAVLGGTLALLPAAPGLPATVQTAPPQATWAVVYLAIVPGTLGYLGWSHVLSRASTAVAGSALYLVPAFSMLLSNLMLGEVPSAAALAGGLLVLAGVATVHGRKQAAAGSTASTILSAARVARTAHDVS